MSAQTVLDREEQVGDPTAEEALAKVILHNERQVKANGVWDLTNPWIGLQSIKGAFPID